MPRLTFDTDRAFAAFLIAGTATLVLELAFPDVTRPFQVYFDWGGAQIMGMAGWMAFCVSLLVAAIAGWRR